MTKKEEILKFLGEDWNRFEGLMKGALDSDISLLRDINGSILANSGKQLRPILCMLVARACSGDSSLNDSSIFYAAASELLHNATLLHDDVADQSDERRGRPTVMSLMGPTASVLIGDFWLVKAMNMVLNAGCNDAAVRDQYTKTLTDLAEVEMLQLEKAASGDTSEDDYLRIIYCKTASLFEASCYSGAASVTDSEELRSLAREYGRSLGMAFQIKDDIMDYFGGNLGKPVGVDIREKKITLPLLGALRSVGAEEGSKVRKMVCEIDRHPEYYDAIVDFVVRGHGRDYASSRLNEYVSRAVGVVERLPESAEKNILKDLAAYAGNREI